MLNSRVRPNTVSAQNANVNGDSIYLVARKKGTLAAVVSVTSGSIKPPTLSSTTKGSTTTRPTLTTTSTTTTTTSTSTIAATTTTTTTTTSTTTTSTSTAAATTSTTTTTTSTSTTTTTVSTTTSTITTTTTTALSCTNWKWNTTATTVAGNSIAGTSLAQLNKPWNVYVHPTTNDLYIADTLNHRVVRWSPGAASGTLVAGVTNTAGSNPKQFNEPRDVFVDSAQNIFVADTINKRIQYFPNGSTNGITITSTWNLGEIYGFFIDNNSIYACDYGKGAVWLNNTVAAGNNGVGAGSNQLKEPQGCTIFKSALQTTVYVANTQQHTIVKWILGASSGTVVAGTNGILGSSDVSLKYPTAVKVDFNGNLFVVDNNNHRIQLFCQYPTASSSGRKIAGTGVEGSSATTLRYPTGIAFDSSLNLYVADASNHRVQKFTRIA